MTSTFSKTPTSQLLYRQTTAINPRTMSATPVHCSTEIPPAPPAGWEGLEPWRTAAGDALGEGVPPTVPGPEDGLGEDEGDPDGEGEGDGLGLGFGLGDTRGVGVASEALIV